MAKQQYRITTDSGGTSNYGYAYLAIVNPSGSGKKFTLRSLEVAIHSVINTTRTTGAIPATLVRCGLPAGGEDMVRAAVVADSSTGLPSSCVVRRAAVVTATGTVNRADLSRRGGAVGGQNRLLFGTPMGVGKRNRRPLFGQGHSAQGGGNAEALVLNQNEAVALLVDPTAGSATNPMRVSVTLAINGKTASWDFNANACAGLALFSVENTSANPVKLLSWSVADMGTTDTPTLRVVPIGQLYAGDVSDTSKQAVSILKMDSTYPAFPGSLYTDVGFIPSGVPEIAISPASAGTPAGMNYLHTRDFWGPMYRNMLVEVCHMKGVGSGIPDTFGLSYQHAGTDLLARGAALTINQGEGIAIVNSAETAVGVQAAYGGWNPMSFSAQVDVEPASIPVVALTGMVQNSRWRIEKATGGALVATGVADVTGATSFSYTDEDYPLNLKLKVRKASAAPFYKPYEVTFSLSSTGVSIPVSQIADA